MDDTASKTGENNYRRTGISLAEVSFNGNKGVFYERAKDAKKDEQTGKYPKTQITKDGGELSVVFLKIRRVLSVYKKGGAGMRTNEHNHKNETVVLYKPNKEKEYGKAADLRTKYETLRTQQIIYAYLPTKDEVVRLTIKGSSLGSDFKHPKGVLKFYEYLQAFASNEHSHEFVTKLTPVKEEGPQGEYYALSFVRGEKLDEEGLSKVKTLIDEVHEATKAQDERLKAGFGKPSVASQDEAGETETPEADTDEEDAGVEYPTEDINPDDIPF